MPIIVVTDNKTKMVMEKVVPSKVVQEYVVEVVEVCGATMLEECDHEERQ